MPKYPNIMVKLTGTDGNVFALIGKVREGLRRGKVSDSEVSQFSQEVMAASKL